MGLGTHVQVATVLGTIMVLAFSTPAFSEAFDTDEDQLASVPVLERERVWQAFRAIQYGSLESNDVAQAIGTDADGNVFIAGTTSPMNSSSEGWGNMAPGDQSAGKDGFLAKLAGSGDLAWVRRFGSPRDDVVHAMVVTNYAAYVCGETEGNLGMQKNAGGRDIFVIKYSLTGGKLWANAFQMGSGADDICKNIVVSSETAKAPSIFISGQTSGLLFPGQSPPAGGQTHRFLAKLIETRTGSPTGPTVILKRGIQRGSHGENSADCLAVGLNDRLYMLTNQYTAGEIVESKATAVLEIYDQEVLAVHQTEQLRVSHDHGFLATHAVVMPGTGDLYVAVASVFRKTRPQAGAKILTRRDFGIIKLKADPKDATVTHQWTAQLGSAVLPRRLLEHQKVTMAIDILREQVHIAGISDGFYAAQNGDEVIISVPIYSLHTSNGSIARYVLRTTQYPSNVEDITDLAVHPGNRCVIYCGVVSGSQVGNISEFAEGQDFRVKNAVVGGLGSPIFVSRTSSTPISTSLEAEGVLSSAVGEGSAMATLEEKDVEKGGDVPRLGAVGGAAIGVSAVGGTLLLAVFVSSLARNSGRNFAVGGWDSSNLNGQISVNGPISVVGGSAAPQ